MRWISRFRRWLDRRRQPQVIYYGEYERDLMLITGVMH